MCTLQVEFLTRILFFIKQRSALAGAEKNMTEKLPDRNSAETMRASM